MTDYSKFLVPTDVDRRRLFYYIKKASSLTTWERVCSYYKRFSDLFEQAYKDDQTHPNPTLRKLVRDDKVITILKGCASCEECMRRLRMGDRIPFKWQYASGHFSDVGRVVGYWEEARYRGMTDIDVSEMRFKFWPQINYALDEAATAWNVNVEPALEPRYLDDPAPIFVLEQGYGSDFLEFETLFPPGELPPAPEPERNVLVKTGDSVPCFGIYEPVKVEMKSRFLGLRKEPVVPADGHFEPIGCMNYLHEGSPAPLMAIPDAPDTPPGRLNTTPVVWRLIWEDRRYVDGTIPEEEQHYAYREYVPKEQEVSTRSAEPERHPLVVQESGYSAAKTGRWLLEGNLDVVITIAEQFDKLPQHQGRNVNWVWAG